MSSASPHEGKTEDRWQDLGYEAGRGDIERCSGSGGDAGNGGQGSGGRGRNSAFFTWWALPVEEVRKGAQLQGRGEPRELRTRTSREGGVNVGRGEGSCNGEAGGRIMSNVWAGDKVGGGDYSTVGK